MKRSPINARPPKVIVDANDSSELRVIVNESEESIEMAIFDRIGENPFTGEGVKAKDVVDMLSTNRNKAVNVRINSFGGDVYDGFVIYNALSSHTAGVTVTIEGIAFSAASFIAMAGEKVRMFKTSDFGIHESATVAFGNKREMRSAMDWLTTIDEHLVDIYAARTGKGRKQIENWLQGESDGTVFSAQQAVEYGFADEIIEPKAGKKDAAKKTATAYKTMVNRAKLRLAR